MTVDQFWNDDEDLLYIYQKAYLTKIHEEAYLNGAYFDIALTTNLYNFFGRKNNSDKPKTYPPKPIYNPFLAEEKKQKNINGFDCTKNNNAIFGLKAQAKERRKINGKL